MIRPKPSFPVRIVLDQDLAYILPRVQLNFVSLTIGKPDRFNRIKLLKRPSKGNGRILPPGEQYQCPILVQLSHMVPPLWD